MTHAKQILLLILVVSAGGAHANPSKLIGSWIGPCEEDQGVSYQNRIVVQPGGQMLNMDLNYAGPGCTGTPSTQTSTAPYQILSETATTVTASFQPAAAGEGSPVDVVGKATFSTPNALDLEVVRAKVIRGGVPTELSEAEVTALPVMSYTRN